MTDALFGFVEYACGNAPLWKFFAAAICSLAMPFLFFLLYRVGIMFVPEYLNNGLALFILAGFMVTALAVLMVWAVAFMVFLNRIWRRAERRFPRLAMFLRRVGLIVGITVLVAFCGAVLFGFAYKAYYDTQELVEFLQFLLYIAITMVALVAFTSIYFLIKDRKTFVTILAFMRDRWHKTLCPFVEPPDGWRANKQ